MDYTTHEQIGHACGCIEVKTPGGQQVAFYPCNPCQVAIATSQAVRNDR